MRKTMPKANPCDVLSAKKSLNCLHNCGLRFILKESVSHQCGANARVVNSSLETLMMLVGLTMNTRKL